MNIWLIEIIHNIDILCNITFFYLMAYRISYIHACRKLGTEPTVSETDLLARRIWYIALAGVIFIPSKEALQTMFG